MWNVVLLIIVANHYRMKLRRCNLGTEYFFRFEMVNFLSHFPNISFKINSIYS